MRMTALTIKNFKGIDERGVRIDFAPVTLLFGPNNAGKSTVIQALYLAREAFCHPEPDLEYTEPSGKGLDLGSFKDYVHGHDISRIVSIGLELQTDGLPLLGDSLELQQRAGWEEIEPLLEMVQSVYVEIGIRWNAAWGRAELAQCGISVNGTKLTVIELDSRTMTASFRPLNVYAFLSKDAKRLLAGDILEDVWKRINTHPDDYGNEFLDYRNAVLEHISPLLQPFSDLDAVTKKISTIDLPIDEDRAPIVFSLGKTPALDWNAPLPLEYADIQPDYDPLAVSDDSAMNCLTLLSSLLLGPCSLTRKILSTILYIGPLRAIPDRGQHRPQKPTFHRWAEGLAAWDVLATATDEQLEEVNRRLNSHDFLTTDYSIVRKRILPLDAYGPLALALRQSLLEDFDENSLPLLRTFLEQSPEIRVALRNDNTGVEVEPHDMGTGISQIIPIVVAAAFPKRDAVIAIEQPELHIHPAWQTALGDIFIQAVHKENPPAFLLETHSEHLLLRLLRRIRNTHKGAATEFTRLSHSDLAVHWIGTYEGRTEIYRLGLDEDGSFNTPWPEGFFDERGEELFG